MLVVAASVPDDDDCEIDENSIKQAKVEPATREWNEIEKDLKLENLYTFRS